MNQKLPETSWRDSLSQLGSSLQILPQTTQLNQRVLGEAAVWLDRIQEACETEVKYDRIEAIQKLLPQWKTVVDQAKKGMEIVQTPTTAQSLKLDLAMLCASHPLPPRLVPQPQPQLTA